MSESKIVLTIDDELKNEAEDLFASLGLNLETAISMFLTKSINEGGIPFEVKQTKFVESPDFISSHFTIKSAVYEINEYIKDRFNEEPSFYLACENRGLTDDEASKLFILFSNPTLLKASSASIESSTISEASSTFSLAVKLGTRL